jgi:hypothetical protein
VRAKIISVSFKDQSKLGLTMRQPLLGNLKWLEAPTEKKEKPEKARKRKGKKQGEKK